MHINPSTLLDVAIGLIFIFFVFSVFVSGIVELINSLLDRRAQLLRLALDKLLGTRLSTDFFNHKLTKVKQEKYMGFWKRVNYLSANSFSTVLIDLMVKAGGSAPGVTPSQQTLASIRQGLQQATLGDIRDLVEPILAKSDDLQTFRAELETWYNGYMEQVSGWFKRYAQGVVWGVSIVITLCFNVDTVHLTDRLFNDNGLRERVVAQATQTAGRGGGLVQKDTTFGRYLHQYHPQFAQADSNQPTAWRVKSGLTASDSLIVQSAYVQFVQSQVEDLKLPISWQVVKGHLSLQPGQTWPWALVGWLLTVSALSFGAPFWFDLLLKLVNIRNTARRPPGNPVP